jgi:phosphoglycolate phosphatase-like HAD superfamily hydrolase
VRPVPSLVLDLDGVVVDALLECALVAWLGVHPARPDRPISAQRPPPEFISGFAAIRPYARTLGHFLVAHRSRPGEITSRAAFERKVTETAEEETAAFVAAATAARDRCRREENAWWLRNHTLYPGLAALLLRHTGRVAVITAKDTGSAWAILRHHGLAGAVTEVVGGCARKDLALTRMCPEPSAVTFVDDSLANVVQVAATGADARWATWGYHTPEDEAVAAALDVPTIDLAGAAALTVAPGINSHRQETTACPRF